jgi:SAM-dependent methyltransferase
MGLLRPHAEPHDVRKVLSIGSGFCFIEQKLNPDFIPHAEILCTDIDRQRLHAFEHPELKKEAVSATELHVPEETFDLVLAHQVLEHINDYPIALDKIASACRPGGLIYINVPNPLSPSLGKRPDGAWPRPFLSALVRHNAIKFNKDFMTNTEKYHTGFTWRRLHRHLSDFEIIDVRKDRVRQEVDGPLAGPLIDLFPSCLLFLFVESNIWICRRKPDASQSAEGVNA